MHGLELMIHFIMVQRRLAFEDSERDIGEKVGDSTILAKTVQIFLAKLDFAVHSKNRQIERRGQWHFQQFKKTEREIVVNDVTGKQILLVVKTEEDDFENVVHIALRAILLVRKR